MNKSKDITSFILFFGGWFLYYNQVILGLRGWYSQLILVVMMAWSVYCYCQVVFKGGFNPVLKALNYLLIMYVLYGLLQLLLIHKLSIESLEYIKKSMLSLVPIFGYYFYVRKLSIGEGGMMLIIIGMLLSAIGEYFGSQIELAERIQEGTMANRDTSEFVIGAVYRFLPILPVLCFIKKRVWFKYTSFLIIIAFVVLSSKRGPLLICGLCLFIFLFDSMKQMGKKIRITHIIIASAAIVAGVYFVNFIINSNDFLLFRLEQMMEGDSSNRDSIYRVLYQHFINEPDIFIFLFGNGANSTLTIAGFYAHNDWLQIALDQGLLGVIIYLYYFIRFYKLRRRSKPNHELFVSIGMFILISLISSMISMSINNYRLTGHFCIAYCLALADLYPIKKKRLV